MKLDGIWMESIELDKIVPIYVENVSKRAVEKMVKILESGDQLSSHVIVEKDRTEDKYWLVAGVNYHFISAQKRLFFAHSFGISLSPFPKECAKFFVNYFGMGHG
ncbi:hypothetical protein GT3570_02675 [Geobacillus thermoleovorans]|uniref:hypothetical protein n=1 Tax=Geobacillus thermoleovorans TaxID=33941 RepID=UPI00078B9025|nr:hypothetical protein GT3570_02675 [Geobacillus thermoleovorans]